MIVTEAKFITNKFLLEISYETKTENFVIKSNDPPLESLPKTLTKLRESISQCLGIDEKRYTVSINSISFKEQNFLANIETVDTYFPHQKTYQRTMWYGEYMDNEEKIENYKKCLVLAYDLREELENYARGNRAQKNLDM